MPHPVRPPIRRGASARRLRRIAIAACLAACQSAPPLAVSPAPFASDGCSMFPDRSPDGQRDWCSCCVAHDLAYWRGGTEQERMAADRELRACVGAAASALLARTMHAGVRIGGGPQLPTSFRWGFGWPHGRGYQAVSEQEDAQLAPLRAQWLTRHPTLACTRPGP